MAERGEVEEDAVNGNHHHIVNNEDNLKLLCHLDEAASVDAHDLCGSELLIDTSLLIKNDINTPSQIMIVTNLYDELFCSLDEKLKFEGLVRQIDPLATFQYLSSFRRARVELSSLETSRQCFDYLNNYKLEGSLVHCYYVQPSILSCQQQYLDLPPRENLFLISPPSSPPIGWEVQLEKKPVINHELLAAIEKMGKSDAYEVYTGVGDMPSIIVHVCDDPPNFEQRPKIIQTRCPERKAKTMEQLFC
ncbi:hypothetical protein HELRODRAFT_185578 [Helobdella robusta]|uniref:Calcipressin n=1 Tax=Helobdella robusta TaxID=6412 RepID=T1FN00_HELRO|nr:hypothetical protein HELRODRAFT_185578 [Helobdella robusta]ESO04712.1 hypothetical protein HELRODRAFT_185578 [Helobdella robusta]